jgi:ABC-type nitrate/sulfonate/bicarbonate transport system substrate-binding protein
MNAASDELAALKTGDISGAWLWTRFMDEARNNPNLHALVNGPQVAPLTVKSWGVYTMRNNWAKENVDTAAKCLELVNQATNWLENNEEQSAELVANEWDLPKNEVLRTSRMVDHYSGIYEKYVDHFKTLHQFGMEHDIMPDFTIEDYILREPAKRAEGVKVQQDPPSDLGDDLPNQPY